MARKSPKTAVTAQESPPRATPKPRRVAKQQEASAITKAARVLAALQQPGGTTVAEISKATGWQAHSVRGFLSGTVRKKLGLDLTVKQADGERRYHVAA